ncbi:outer membrane protein assembly factor BamB family protein, partial [Streptomyces aureus]|uniref:outer membrane protein assembly factor BamB family protein n=1 Tax=Streptomyces aureus TaxID=193461 RepID=UPI000AB546C4
PRLTLAVAAALALTGAGLYAAMSPPAGGGSEPPARPDEVATAFTGWHTTLQMHGPTAAPACTHGGGALYCAARGVGLARLDPVTGKVVWSRTGPVEAESPVAPFLLADGLVGAAAPADPLRAYAAADGAPGWAAGSAKPPELYVPAGSAVVLTDGRGGVRAVGSLDGKELWRHGLDGFQAPRPGPYDAPSGLLTVSETSADGTHTRVAEIRPRTGEPTWQRNMPGDLDPLGRTGDGALLLASRYQASLFDRLVVLDPGRGSVRELPLPHRLDVRGVAVRGAVVHILEADGHLTAFDTAAPKGRVLWELETGAGNVSTPVTGPGDRLYFSVQDGRLLAVDTVRGALIGQTRPRLLNGRLEYAPLVPPPVVVGDRVFGTAPDGSVFAVDARDPASW